MAFVREVQEIVEKIERGRGTYEGDKPPVQTFTERRGKTRDDTKKTLKTVSEDEIRVNTDEYPIYEGVIEGKT